MGSIIGQVAGTNDLKIFSLSIGWQQRNNICPGSIEFSISELQKSR